jgi:hypothetical protein
MKKLNKIFKIFLIIFLSGAAVSAQTVSGGIFNNGSTLEVRAKVSGGNISGIISQIVFTIRWNDNYGVSLGDIISPEFNLQKQGIEDVHTAELINYRYQKFGATPNTEFEWIEGIEYTLLQVPVNQTGEGTGTFELAPNDFFLDMQEDWYIEINAEDRTDEIFYKQQTSDVPLPVELISFSAKYSDEYIEILWSTAAEINNYGFEIEKKLKDNWEKIGFKEGHGNSNSKKSYNFFDKNLSGGKNLYRLKQIDNDGTFEYSGIVEVDVKLIPKDFNLSQNYPNPFNPSTKIKFSIPSSQNPLPDGASGGLVTLIVYDILGNEAATLINESYSPGEYEADFNAEGLSSGVYIARLSFAGQSRLVKMNLLK